MQGGLRSEVVDRPACVSVGMVVFNIHDSFFIIHDLLFLPCGRRSDIYAIVFMDVEVCGFKGLLVEMIIMEGSDGGGSVKEINIAFINLMHESRFPHLPLSFSSLPSYLLPVTRAAHSSSILQYTI